MGTFKFKRDGVAGKALNMLLALVLVVSLAPSAAYATASDADADVVAAEQNAVVESDGASPDSEDADTQDGSTGETLEQGAEPTDSASDESATNNESSSDDSNTVESENSASDGNVESRQANEPEGSQNEASATSEEDAVVAALSSTGSSSEGTASSVESLDPGTYTISANVSMLTPLGITAYATNPQNPLGIGTNGVPGAPVTNNAELVVSEDGTRTLTFELVNPVFTVQDFSDGDNVTVVSKERVDIEEDTTDSSYIEEVHDAGYTTRVSRVVVTLGDWGGTYEFKDCSEFATALRDAESLSYGKFNIPLKLTVDYENAVRHVEGSFEKSFADDATGVQLLVEAEETSSAIDDLQVSEFKVSDVTEQKKDAIDQALTEEYKSTPSYKAYNLSLVANGNAVSTDDKVKLTASFAGEYSNLYLLKNGVLTSLDVSSVDGKTSAELKLGTVICVESEGADAWEWSHTYTDSTTSASITYATDTTVDDVALNGEAIGMGAETLDFYSDYFSAVSRVVDDEDLAAKVSDTMSLANSEDCQIDAVWGVALDISAGTAHADFPGGYNISVGEDHNCLKVTLPISNDGTDLYIVSGTVGTLTNAIKVASSVAKGYGTFDLISSTTKPAASSVPFHNAAMGTDRYGKAQTDDTEVAYIVAVSKKKTAIDKPAAATNLVYNGKEQVGVVSGEGYTLSGDASATKAGIYEATATLNEGYVWSDGTTDPVTLSYIIAPAKLAAGTYIVTANLSMPGEYNPVLSGMTVYTNNPNNPFGIDEGTSAFAVDSTKAPVDAMSMNATLVVDENGNKTLVLPIDNPVFTTQSLGTCDELTDVWVQRVSSPIKTSYNQSATSTYSYGKYQTRISKVGVALTDELTKGAATYNFKGSSLYALPLDMDIAPSGDIALQLTVDYDTVKKASDSTAVSFSKTSDNGSALGALVSADSGDKGNSGSGDNQGTDSGNQGNNGGSDNSGTSGNQGDNGTVDTNGGHYAAGTYTVSGNVWLPKSSTGLPLNPHLSSGVFPPKDPVSSNATMTVDSTGHAWVTIPVLIQDKVMVVNNVTGSGVSFNGASIVIDLGTPSAGQTSFSGTCACYITMGALASTISGKSGDFVWDGNWEVNFGTADMSSGGGTIPASALAAIAGVSGTVDAATAENEALAALEDGNSSTANSVNGRKATGSTNSGSSNGTAEGVTAEDATSPVLPIVLSCVAALAVAAGVGGFLFARKRKQGEEQTPQA